MLQIAPKRILPYLHNFLFPYLNVAVLFFLGITLFVRERRKVKSTFRPSFQRDSILFHQVFVNILIPASLTNTVWPKKTMKHHGAAVISMCDQFLSLADPFADRYYPLSIQPLPRSRAPAGSQDPRQVPVMWTNPSFQQPLPGAAPCSFTALSGTLWCQTDQWELNQQRLEEQDACPNLFGIYKGTTIHPFLPAASLATVKGEAPMTFPLSSQPQRLCPTAYWGEL